ncbi:MAG: SH3 domain-containing protein [Alphaproteobacteria bacterium]|nr:SH3 domain-containing protein [Alphaproteobacteria bacterium]MDX5368384.1 SH3 domain-containing protein [Alphaproteobacteria bacterium]MDX5463179.1 SH3 domain-containing protein [Alphaproteobacteria bacterium]
MIWILARTIRLAAMVSVLVAVMTGASALPIGAQTASSDGPRIGASTGLPLPRFVSIKSGEVNVRRGPGTNYPIDWVFVRAGVPVEIIAESDHWRKIRDVDGATGWVHKQLLQGDRMALILGAMNDMIDSPYGNFEVVARIEGGVIARLEACDTGWCRLRVGSVEGWLPKSVIYGVYPEETFK